jgi:hypothetical protein
MSDVFLPKFGGEGDGDSFVVGTGWRGAVVIVGGGGDSRKSIASIDTPSNADNAAILDKSHQTTMSAQDLYAVAGLLYSHYYQIAKLIIVPRLLSHSHRHSKHLRGRRNRPMSAHSRIFGSKIQSQGFCFSFSSLCNNTFSLFLDAVCPISHTSFSI